MNNFEKEYAFLVGKIYGPLDDPYCDETDESYEQYVQRKGGIVCVEEKDGDLLYQFANGDFLEPVSLPRLKAALENLGEITKIEITELYPDKDTVDRAYKPLDDYLKRLREEIANNPDFDPQTWEA
jgi:hypothetical protein